MNSPGLSYFTFILIISLSITAQIQADVALYGSTNSGGSSSQLVQIDTTSGQVSVVGTIGFAVNGMSFDATTNTLFASTSTNDPNFNGLIEIDLHTGVGTQVGQNGWGLSGMTGYGTVNNITLDSAGNMFGWVESFDDLVSINKTTGIATIVGDFGTPTVQNGLAFDANDNLFMVGARGNTFQMNPSDGSGSFLFDLGPPSALGDFNPDNNFYYGLPIRSADPSTIDFYDLSSGTLQGSFDTDTGFQIHTLAFAPIPEPTGFAFVYPTGILFLLVRRRH